LLTLHQWIQSQLLPTKKAVFPWEPPAFKGDEDTKITRDIIQTKVKDLKKIDLLPNNINNNLVKTLNVGWLSKKLHMQDA